ncbi:Txe/YoeB family addiction module toxin [Moorena sp. SIO3H5]|uniref:Txe/YoeB family addiction module toxin n=1 Tax=Moorena sp. SIO3H5 TaxID=2607834 RepID=UPI003418FEB6
MRAKLGKFTKNFVKKIKNSIKPFVNSSKKCIRDDPAKGMGKPEPLKHNLSGLWSRRLSQKDRLIYKFDDNYIYIFAIGGHYDQFN